MKINEIKTGTKIEMEMYDENGERIIPNFTSQFEAAADEQTAIIAAPIYEGNLYPVRLNWFFNGYFYTKDDINKFRARVVGRGLNDGIAHLKVEILGNIKKIQRREFFRFDCSVPIKYKVADQPSVGENGTAEMKKAMTRDLSGGGVCIKLEEKIEVNSTVECELSLGEKKTVKFKGKVVRSSRREKDIKYGFEIGVIFEQIEYAEKEAVIAFIFNEQRRLRKKGLI